MRLFPFSLFAQGNRRRSRHLRRGPRHLRRPSASLTLEVLEDRCLPSCNVISGYVFNDANNSGLFNSNDSPIANSPVQLLNSSGVVIGNAVTDANGFYSFSTDSTISTAPTTLTRTASLPSTSTDFTQSVSIPQFDPSLGTLTAIDIVNAGTFTSHIKVESLDGAPSTITATDSGLLSLSGLGLTALVTNSSTSQSFNASAFDGVIDFAGTSGHDFGSQTAPGSTTITLSSPADLAMYTGTGTVTFSEVAHATSGATGAGNLLTQINTSAGAQVTAVYHYIPSNCLRPGTYTIHQMGAPPGFLDGLESTNGVVIPNSVGTNSITVTLASNDLMNNDFAKIQPSSLSGFVYFDPDNNGIKEPGEVGIAGLTVSLSGNTDLGTSLSLSTTTAADGSYSFAGLRPGVYTLSETQPGNYLAGKISVGSAGGSAGDPQISNISLVPGVSGVNYNFAELLPPNATGLVLGNSFGSTNTTPPQLPSPDVLSKLMFLASSGSQTLDPSVMADSAYVNGLYLNILDRPADGDGLAYWVQQLQNGTPRSQIVDGIWNSAEHRGLEVDHFYALFLNRGADPAGRAYWVSRFLAGESEVDVARGFLGSSEFQADHPDNVSYATALYADVLGRAGGSTEISSWVGVLQSGSSRDAVALGFLNSAEADLDVINSCYTLFLHSALAPAQAQQLLANIQSGRATPQATCEDVLASDQYFAQAQPASNG